MKPEEKMEFYRKKILDEITRISKEQIAFAQEQSSSNIDFMNITNEYLKNSGKMLRGLLIVTTYEAIKGKVDDEIFKAAASIEICQSYLLAHDDIADEAAVRRGGPSYHYRTIDLFKQRNSSFENLAPDSNLNIGLGIVGGDYLDALAQEILCDVNLEPENILKAVCAYSVTLKKTGYGQVLDILSGVTPMDKISENDIKAIHRLKTASYTLIYPLQCGCYLAGGSQEHIKCLSEFGDKVGRGFQIVDDILGSGLIEDESDKTKNDIEEGKKTLLLLETWKKAEEVRPIIDRLGKEGVSEEEIELVKQAMREVNAVEKSWEEAERLLEEGLEALNSIELLPEGKEFLEYVAHRLIHRKK